MMGFPKRETVERLRRDYPVGCRVVLDSMDDPIRYCLSVVRERAGVWMTPGISWSAGTVGVP